MWVKFKQMDSPSSINWHSSLYFCEMSNNCCTMLIHIFLVDLFDCISAMKKVRTHKSWQFILKVIRHGSIAKVTTSIMHNNQIAIIVYSTMAKRVINTNKILNRYVFTRMERLDKTTGLSTLVEQWAATDDQKQRWGWTSWERMLAYRSVWWEDWWRVGWSGQDM